MKNDLKNVVKFFLGAIFFVLPLDKCFLRLYIAQQNYGLLD